MRGPIALAAALWALAPPAAGVTIVSYGVEAGQPSVETLEGTSVRPVDAIDADTAALAFSAFPSSPIEDIDAFHVLIDGDIVFSTSTDVTQGFGGLSSFKDGDLIRWDGSTATLMFSEEIAFGGSNHNVDAFSMLPNGNWLLSTSLTATLGGLTFDNGDIVTYDPVSDTASLYMGLDEATLFTGVSQSNADIDALHVLANGNLVISIRSDGVGRFGTDLTYGFADTPRTDLVEINPTSLAASLYLDGAGLFDGSTRNIDAVFIPEPSTAALLGLGLVGIAVGRRRRAA